MTEKLDPFHPLAMMHRRGLEDIAWMADTFAQASEDEKDDYLKTWGEKIAFHLTLEKQSSYYSLHASSRVTAGQIGKSIVSFFEAAKDTLVKLPWPHPFGEPNNTALSSMVSILDALENTDSTIDPPTGHSATMEYVLNTLQWNPDGLWTALASTQTMAERQLSLPENIWQNQPFWRFTAQLGIQACLTDWQPNNNSLSDKMWYITPFFSLPNADSGVQTMARKVPWSFGAALEFYKEEPDEHISPRMVKSIFEMDYAQANAGLSTQLLLSLMFDYTRYQEYGTGMQIFQDKHPDLFAAFELQVSLYDGPYDAEKYAPACETVWNHAIHGKPLDCMELPDLSFEGP